jgi:type VI secretion system (T6SS) phospholipase Tle1-like effector
MSGFLEALPIGALLGVALAPWRLSGVDFRQWFQNLGNVSESADDTWIGAMRDTSHILLYAIIATFVVVWSVFWYSSQSCLDWPWLDGWRFASCAGSYLFGWMHRPALLGLVAGIVAAQALTEAIWRFALSRAPVPSETRRYLSTAPSADVPTKQEMARPAGRRRLIVCCDGTWNWPDKRRETNVVRLVRAIKPTAELPNEPPISQIVRYHVGVGTGNVLDHWLGGSTGVGLSSSVKQCYEFLADNYRAGDEIFLFGFSRGAYVARSISGLISFVGILQKHEMAWFIDVWDCYTATHDNMSDKEKHDLLQNLAPDRHRPETIDIECIGVWDTVGALGIPGTRLCLEAFSFHDTTLAPGVRHAFQALALDEQRGNFQAAIWVPHSEPYARQLQVLEQVWFPGVHSNIGGGYEKHGLSDTTFLWMVSRLDKYGLLALDLDYVRGEALDDNERYPSGELADSRSLFWKFIGAPVPRPVCITHASEWIHMSAWDRIKQHPPRDVYGGKRRDAWLGAMKGRLVPLSEFEAACVASGRMPKRSSAPPPRSVSERLRWCDKLLRWLAGAG